MHYACKDMQGYAFNKQVYADSIGHMHYYARDMQAHASICKHI